MSQRTAPAPFLTKTYLLVEDESTEEVISWNESGTAFVVWKTAEFAKDLLPNYFKHNNFSSFVRQLNTYGFRKVVPDKWEFANENFRRGQKDLLSKIRRRKSLTPTTTHTQDAGKSGGGNASPSNSGEDLGSTSTSSPDSKNPGTAQFADLSDENEKLKKDNETLSSELAQAKKQCEELVAFLTECMRVGPDQINRIMRQGSCCVSTRDGLVDGAAAAVDDRDEDGNDAGTGGRSLKLFGVLLKGVGKKKRARDEKMGFVGPHPKEIKICN